MLNVAGQELLCQQSITEVMVVLRFSKSCMHNTLRVRRRLSDVKSSNAVCQILEQKESNKTNAIEITTDRGKCNIRMVGV